MLEWQEHIGKSADGIMEYDNDAKPVTYFYEDALALCKQKKECRAISCDQKWRKCSLRRNSKKYENGVVQSMYEQVDSQHRYDVANGRISKENSLILTRTTHKGKYAPGYYVEVTKHDRKYLGRAEARRACIKWGTDCKAITCEKETKTVGRRPDWECTLRGSSKLKKSSNGEMTMIPHSGCKKKQSKLSEEHRLEWERLAEVWTKGWKKLVDKGITSMNAVDASDSDVVSFNQARADIDDFLGASDEILADRTLKDDERNELLMRFHRMNQDFAAALSRNAWHGKDPQGRCWVKGACPSRLESRFDDNDRFERRIGDAKYCVWDANSDRCRKPFDPMWFATFPDL